MNPSAVAVEAPSGAPPTSDAEGLRHKSLSPRQMAWRRYRSHRPAMIATVVLLLMVIFVLLAPITARYGVNEAVFKTEGGVSNRYLSPRSEAWFGTDDIGRDLYSRLIYGTRVSLAIGLAAAVIAVVIGTAVGAIAGLRGGWFDDLLMRVTDIFLAFPFLVALLVTRNMLGQIPWLEPIIGERTSIRFIILLLVAVRLDGGGARRAGPGAGAQRTGVHRGVARDGRRQPPDHRPPPAAELASGRSWWR